MLHNKIYIIMYHYVRDLARSRYPKLKGLDYHLFREQIRYLKRHFHIVTMEEIIEACDTGRQIYRGGVWRF